MKKNFFIIILLSLNSILFGQTIEGKVIDQYGNPLSVAIQQFFTNCEGFHETSSDENGKFIIKLDGVCKDSTNLKLSLFTKGYYQMELENIDINIYNNLGVIPMYTKEYIDSLVMHKKADEHLKIEFPNAFNSKKVFKQKTIGKMFKRVDGNIVMDYLWITYQK